jgi:AraC family transcriptional regulator, transcriptional activator of pobA
LGAGDLNFEYRNQQSGGALRLYLEDSTFDRAFFTRDRAQKYLTIAWNQGPSQRVVVDEVEYDFPSDSILPLMVNQSFRFERPTDMVAWQFNREFYCIVDHDQEVGCVGFLFYGLTQTLFVTLERADKRKIELLFEVFKDEFATVDTIQGEMLRLLLVRLIITVTRLAKKQQLPRPSHEDARHDLVRRFNLLVENHYRAHHDVRFYADLLNKSPKTLTNTFARYSERTPQRIIQDRVFLEAKRLMYYTDKTGKEIANELGFDDAAHFSRFFKNLAGQSPTVFKESLKIRQ